MKNTISIVVPVYNAEKTLSRCVQSLLEQTYEHIEILLVNDGSKDGSLELCKKYAAEDSRIHVIDKPNGGVSSARNAELEAATGEYVMFCDSDDWAEPDWCAAMLHNHVPGDMTVCQILREDYPLDEKVTSAEMTVEVAKKVEFLHYPLLMCSLFNKIYERAVIEEHGICFSRELRLGEDFVFVLDYLCQLTGQVRFLSHGFYHYDVSVENSLSKRPPEMMQCDLFFRSIAADMEKLGIRDKESLDIRDRFALTQFESVLMATSLDNTLTIAQKIKRAKEIGKLDSFRSCNGNVVFWGNPLYNWCFHRKHMVVLMWYLIIRNALKS